jgi:hypothetical protein
MDLFEVNTHSFIVKIWLEKTATGARGAVWRGHVTHVPSGKRRYVRDLHDILGFIALYLEGMNVKLGVCWHMRHWLRRRWAGIRAWH